VASNDRREARAVFYTIGAGPAIVTGTTVTLRQEDTENVVHRKVSVPM